MIFAKVLVIGCGNIGRWHIKGLESARGEIFVDVVDCSRTSTRKLKEMLLAGLLNSRKLRTRFWSDLDGLIKASNDHYDLVILATTAHGRARILENVCLNLSFSHAIVEKPLEQSVAEIERLQSLSADHNMFTNHPRRLMPLHARVKQRLQNHGPLHCYVGLGSGGVCCNASHFIDLVNWWTGEKPVDVSTNKLNKKWVSVRRRGFWDVEGEVEIGFDGGSLLSLRSDGNPTRLNISVSSLSGEICVISEQDGLVNFGSEQIADAAMVPQSELTGQILNCLLDTGSCGLPTLQNAAECSKLFTETLAAHWSEFVGCDDALTLPIT